MSRIKPVLAAAAAGIALCAFAPAALAALSGPPQPIGDSCLVGSWVETQQSAPGNWAWNGQVVAVSGLRGMMIRFTADGIETDDLSVSQPLVGDYLGHQLKIVERGKIQFHVSADGTHLAQSAPLGGVPVSYYLDGQLMQGGAAYQPGLYTYSCGSTTLHRETPAHISGYGPLVDDLVRAPAASSAGGGSLVSPFSSSLATPASVFAAPLTLLASAAIALAAVLFITFPSHLFNRTYEQNHEVIRYWWERRLPWLLRLRLGVLAGGRRGLRDGLGFLAVVICGGVLASLLDPHFGPNLRTLSLFIGAVFALIAGSLIGFGGAAAYRIARNRPGPWHLHALPSGLIVAGACVLVSRLAGFQPGYLYGLIGGVVFARRLTWREEGHSVAITSLVTLAVAFAAWLAWVPVSTQSAAHTGSFGLAVASNFLAAVFVSGMVGLLIGLVPLRFLPGDKLAGWHRGVWGAVFGVAALSVIEVMLRPERGGAHVTTAPFLITAGLFVGFGLASVAFWGYFKVRQDSTSHAKAQAASTTDN